MPLSLPEAPATTRRASLGRKEERKEQRNTVVEVVQRSSGQRIKKANSKDTVPGDPAGSFESSLNDDDTPDDPWGAMRCASLCASHAYRFTRVSCSPNRILCLIWPAPPALHAGARERTFLSGDKKAKMSGVARKVSKANLFLRVSEKGRALMARSKEEELQDGPAAFNELIKQRGELTTCLPGHNGGMALRIFASAAVISTEREHMCALACFEQG